MLLKNIFNNTNSKFKIYQLRVYFSKWQLADYGIAWILFFSIFFQKFAPIGLGLILISTIYNRLSWKRVKFIQLCLKGPISWFILYYLLLLLGMLWSQNLNFGYTKLENKLTFILFPFLFSFSNITLKIPDWKNIFLFSLFFTLFTYECIASVKFLFYTDFDTSCFIDSPFIFFMHRSYFACYLVIGVILIFEKTKQEVNILNLFLIIFFTTGIFQSGSKSGTLCLFVVFLVYAGIFFLKYSKKYILLLISALLFLLGYLFFTNNLIKSRFELTAHTLKNFKVKENTSIESNMARLIMWNTSIEVWKEQFVFGVGTGDYDDVLTNKNIEFKNTGVSKERLNSHNQFLNTGVQLGIIGFLVLLMIFISSWLIKPNSTWRNLILIVFFINFQVESFLETQAGIVLFCVLLILFFTPKKDVIL